MRPCNQCRQPVENSVTICDRCKEWNQSHLDDEPDGSIPHVESPEEHDSGLYSDHSYAILMGAFSLVITALFALIGAAVNGYEGFLIGGAIGFVVGLALFTLMIKM